MVSKMIIDADICIKLGGSEKHRFLYNVLPLVAEQIYMHSHAYGEVLMPPSAVRQLQELIAEQKVQLVNESELDNQMRTIYDMSYHNLEKVMLDPRRPGKNKGEMCSLAYAKATEIPVFATDEKDLQPIIDTRLNTGINNITCIRIIDIIFKARDKEIMIPRKVAKALWLVAGKKKEIFDEVIWKV